MNTGKLIAFAGGEGSGKSTCMQHVQQKLPSSITFTREPGGVPIAEKARDIVVHHDLSPYEQLLQVAFARSVHFRTKILPAICAGTHVITDRCFESTWAYQIVATESEETLGKLYSELTSRSCHGIAVSLWVDFRIDPEVALQRRLKDPEKVNAFDILPLEYHKKVRRGLDMFFAHNANNVVHVNATLPEHDLTQAVHEIIKTHLSL